MSFIANIDRFGSTALIRIVPQTGFDSPDSAPPIYRRPQAAGAIGIEPAIDRCSNLLSSSRRDDGTEAG